MGRMRQQKTGMRSIDTDENAYQFFTTNAVCRVNINCKFNNKIY